jgi:hypothetical protein
LLQQVAHLVGDLNEFPAGSRLVRTTRASLARLPPDIALPEIRLPGTARAKPGPFFSALCPTFSHPVTKIQGFAYNDSDASDCEGLTMERITLADAARDFSGLVQRVEELNDFLKRLPVLGDDAEALADDLRAIRQGLPKETDPWD